MPVLLDQLTNFVDTINNGPTALDPELFAGPADRVILGLKAHANTISHARLIALEETFPMTRGALGDDIFNSLSRAYIETETGRSSDNNRIGAGFPDFLAGRNIESPSVDLARIEWAWLQSYHAAEAASLQIAELATLDEATMLALAVDRHPAAQIVMLNAPLSPQLQELGDASGAAAILITRPESEVRLLSIDAIATAIFNKTGKFSQMSNLLSVALEQAGEAAPLEPILALVGAGALTKTRMPKAG